MRTRDYDKQQRIKEAMVHLILREGINGASVAKIAREAGVSPATIYVYYESKEDMLSAAFREYALQSYQYLTRRLRPGMGAAELIEAIVRGYYAYTWSTRRSSASWSSAPTAPPWRNTSPSGITAGASSS